MWKPRPRLKEAAELGNFCPAGYCASRSPIEYHTNTKTKTKNTRRKKKKKPSNIIATDLILNQLLLFAALVASFRPLMPIIIVYYLWPTTAVLGDDTGDDDGQVATVAVNYFGLKE